ncbi:TM2 domain-containing protein [Lolliginicoccus suaedae]|uniref:TM2 domain-containing protein n=1 Tax=Lolliginicoccus suaedae TaxID=2605429 RepID=UPI0011EC07FE|nr:TM2 domain-containing protein [Lolliginicoccus suaedae]
MTTPPPHPSQQPHPGQSSYAGPYTAGPHQPGQYPHQGQYGAHYSPMMGDPYAPFGRDPMTGEPLSSKSKIVAGILQIFLGVFGIGRFYIGSNALGIVQLVTWFIGLISVPVFGLGLVIWFFLGIWAFIDGIFLMVSRSRDGNGYLLR